MPRANLRPYNYCASCGYRWSPRGHNQSWRCPQCGSAETRVDYSGLILGALVVAALFCAKPCSDWLESFEEKGVDSKAKPSTAADVAPWKPKLAEGKVTLKKDCDLWGYDEAGQALVVRSAAKGEQYTYVEHDRKSTEILDVDGARHLWIVNKCAR